MIFIGFGVLLSVCTLPDTFVWPIVNDSQTAKAIHADQDALSETFERIEAFFRRLDIYTEVTPNEGMVATITAIMIEALNFIGIATKEIKQGQISKRSFYK
jgi:hypothetical protein